MREEDDKDSRQGGAEVTRRRRRRGQPPWRGVCCPESWGGNCSDILYYFIGQPTQHPPPISLPSPTQLASSIGDVRCHRLSSSFLSSSCFVAASKLHAALLVESFVHTMQASKRFFGIAPHKAPLAAHPPPPPREPIVILPRLDPLGNEDGPGSEYDGRILAN